MENSFSKDFIFISITLLIAMMLTILPLPAWAVWLRPAWVFMVLLFWMMTMPHRVNIGTAFISGLLLDLLTGTMVGQHALLFTIISYFFIRFQAIIHSLPSWQQTILVSISVVVYLAIQYWIMVMANVSPITAKYWLPILSTMLLWPWVRFLLRNYHHRFRLD
ncbi:rod shape-determining protein MreD [Coxiella endosymbiont of Amblyomma nuttalli]|uniref:rod shape-determining protein MreD n=1 Tax=Coxiella endosymbiont of Amblyomma nuttalli TaxID=2749996 RepID=UPI001BAA4270|nr:rod shape-determining protein MreD [Coxiella endosymbiont of Amblyomma nuttalli]QTS83661.1 Rod shape-determining protein MreD [Coxiella endosymbiont of Amblyomma nuttalli]